jgi:hypothetical protein
VEDRVNGLKLAALPSVPLKEGTMLIRRIFCISVLLAIFLFSMVPAANPAGTSEWVEDGVPVCTAQGNQRDIRITSDGVGGAILAWFDEVSSGQLIFTQRLSASGQTMWATDGVAVCTIERAKASLAIVPDGMGGAIMVWSDIRLVGNNDIYTQRVDADGNILWSNNGVAICMADGRQDDVQVASDGYGGAIITWEDHRPDEAHNDTNVYVQHVDASGIVTWANNGIEVYPLSGGLITPSIVSDGSHGAIVSWVVHEDIYAQRFDIDGSKLWDPNGLAIRVSPSVEKDPIMAEVDGGAIIAWSEDLNTSIYAQRVNTSGELLWDPGGKMLCNAVDGKRTDAKIIQDGYGGAILCWLDNRNDKTRDIYAQRVDGSGSVLWNDNGVAVATGPYEYGTPGIAADGLGGAYLVWELEEAARSFAQYVDRTGALVWFNPIVVCGLEYAQRGPQVVSSTSGGAIIAWEDRRSGTSLDIYAQSTSAMKPEGAVWYLAEGSTAGGMETWVLVQNPTESPVDIALDFQTDGGPVSGPRGTLQPFSRRSYNLGAYVTTYDVSTVVSAGTQFVVCERAMYGNNYTWGHDSIGVTEPARTWYLAEGCTAGGMETWVLVQNPGDTAVDVALDFQTGNGLVPGPRETLPANSRRSFNVGKYVTTYDVSTKVTASGGVVCERAMYGNNWTWAHDSIGATEAGQGWVMTEGCTAGGMETWVLVQNPGNTPANVDLIFITDTEVLQGPNESIPPGTRRSYNVGDYVTSYNVSTAVLANSGEVICERAMYGNNWNWGHDSIGSMYSKNVWFLPEGCTAGGMDTWILVLNMSDQNTEMAMFFLTDQGEKAGPHEVLPPFTRKTYYAGDYVTSFEVSTVVVASSPTIICERSMYGNNGAWGHCSIGY